MDTANQQNHKVVGKIEKRVIELIGSGIVNEGTLILLGESNISHMKNEHPLDYEKYADNIEEILSSPTYIAKHPHKDSIEYIKVYENEGGDHVLVAIRSSASGNNIFARTLFVMDPEKIDKYWEKNAFKEY